MINKNWQRLLSLLLVLCMATSPLASNIAFAETGSEGDGFVHDETCGYVEAAAEIPCGHIHDEDCNYAAPILEVACDHTHGESCGYKAPVAEVPCNCDMPEGNHTPECSYTPAVKESPCTHIHGDCSYVAPAAEVACTHTHDDVCGYASAVEGAPCTCVVEEKPVTLAESTTEPGFTAILYNTGDSQGTGGVELQEDGSSLTQVLCGTANLLKILWTVDPTKENVLEISVPEGMEIDTNWTEVETEKLLNTVSFAPLDRNPAQDGIQQAFSTYYNEKTGKLTYTTNVENTPVETIAIDVMLFFDVALWDKYRTDSTGINHNYLTPTGKVNNLTKDPAVTVSFTETSGEGETILTKSIQNVTTNEQLGIQLRGGGNDIYFSVSDIAQPMATQFLSGANNSTVLLKKVDVQYAVSIMREIEAGRLEEQTRDWPEGFFVVDTASLEKNGITWNPTTHTMSYGHMEIKTANTFVSPQYLINADTATQAGLQDGDRLKFTAKFTAESYSGTKLEGTLSVQNWIYAESMDAKIQLYKADGVIYGPALFPEGNYEGYLEELGILSLNNTAGLSESDTIKVVVNFDEGYSGSGAPRMYVNAYNVPLAAGETTTVTAQVITADGSVVPRTYKDIESTSNAAGPCITTESALESFLTVTYEMKVPKGAKLYGNLRYDNSGVFLGRISEDLPAGTKVTSSIQYSESEGEPVSLALEYIRPESPQALTRSAAINMGQATTTVTAGGTIVLKGSLESPYYVRYNPHPVLFLALPKGIPTENISLNYTTASGETKSATVTFSHTHTNDDSVQKNIYRLDLGKDGAYGSVTLDNQGGIKVDNKRAFELKIKTPTSMGRGNYAIKDHLFVTNKVPWLEDTYCTIDYPPANRVAYPYGVSGGDTAAHDFGTIKTSLTDAFDIHPLKTLLDYRTSVKLVKDTDYSESVTVPAATNYIYRVEMENKDPQHVVPTVNTALYIPIPHHNQTLSGFMGSDTMDTSEVRLTGPVAINEAQWLVGYSVNATASNYNNHEATFDNVNGTYATYLTEEEFTAARLDWADVVCVKLRLKEDFPVAGTDAMTMTLQIMPGDVTEIMSYSSSSWSKYDKNQQLVVGGVEDPTNKITLQIGQNTLDMGNLQVETYTDTEYSRTFDNYNGVQFYLTGVKPHNLTLVSPSEIQTNIASNNLPNAATQDSTFGLEIKLNDGEWKDLASLTDADDSLILGDSEEDEDNAIQVRLTNYDTFVDVKTERYVEFTLYDSYNSLHLNFRVDIKRMLSASKPSTGIAAGELYNGISGSTATTASILPDGAATASFQLAGYVPSSHVGGHTLAFSPALPDGTTLILADFTEGGASYYYCNNAGGKTSLALTDFVGLNVSNSFVERNGSDSYNEHFLLIMDFTATAGLASNTDVTMSVKHTDKDQPTAQTVTIQILGAKPHELGTYSTEPADNTLTCDNGFSFTFRHMLNDAESNQYRLANSENNLRISLNAGEIKSFPLGTYALYEGVKYWPEADGKYILIPSSNSAYNDKKSNPVLIEMPYVQLENAINPGGAAPYWITVEWMCAAPNIKGVTQTIGGYSMPTDGPNHIHGSRNYRFSVANEIEKEILLDRDDGHLVSAKDLHSGNATFGIQTQGIEVANVTYVLRDKEGDVLSYTPVSGNTLTYTGAKPGETYVLEASCGGVTDTYVLVTVE